MAEWRSGAGRDKNRLILGPRVKERRIAAGYSTPEELAAALGLPATLIRTIEMGHNENAGVQVVEAICRALKCQMEDLIGTIVSTTDPQFSELSIRRLERLAQKAGWSATDLLELRDQYQHELAARGSSNVLTDADWLARKGILERRRLGAEPTLFNQDNA